MACGGVECHPAFVPLPEEHRVVGIMQVQLGEDGFSLEKLENGRNKRQSLRILDGNLLSLLTPLWSVQGRRVLYFFCTKKTAPTGEDDGQKIPGSQRFLYIAGHLFHFGAL